MKKKKEENIPNPYEQWIAQWKCCQNGALVDSFHSVSTIDNRLYRHQYYTLAPKDWEEISKEFTKSKQEILLRIYMAINPEKEFVPLIRTLEVKNGKVKRRGKLYAFTPIDPLAPQLSSETIPEAFKIEACQRWAAVHPGYIADQFSVLVDRPDSEYSHPITKRKTPIKYRTRVENFTYDAQSFCDMKDLPGVSKIEFHCAINHNHDWDDAPSFIPILSFEHQQEDGTNNQGGTNFEYATPCPPICNPPD